MKAASQSGALRSARGRKPHSDGLEVMHRPIWAMVYEDMQIHNSDNVWAACRRLVHAAPKSRLNDPKAAKRALVFNMSNWTVRIQHAGALVAHYYKARDALNRAEPGSVFAMEAALLRATPERVWESCRLNRRTVEAFNEVRRAWVYGGRVPTGDELDRVLVPLN